MTRSIRRFLPVLAFAILTGAVAAPLVAQRAALTQEQRDQRWELERELQTLAVVERKVMMPMRDGVRLATDIYRPKNADGHGADRLRQDALQLQLLGRAQRRARRHDARRSTAIKRGYAYVVPERARPLLLRGQLRHPRPADHRRLRRDGLAHEAAVVERQGRHDRLLVDRGVAAGGRLARASRRSPR